MQAEEMDREERDELIRKMSMTKLENLVVLPELLEPSSIFNNDQIIKVWFLTNFFSYYLNVVSIQFSLASLCLSLSPSRALSLSLSLYLSIYLYIYLSIYLSF